MIDEYGWTRTVVPNHQPEVTGLMIHTGYDGDKAVAWLLEVAIVAWVIQFDTEDPSNTMVEPICVRDSACDTVIGICYRDWIEIRDYATYSSREQFVRGALELGFGRILRLRNGRRVLPIPSGELDRMAKELAAGAESAEYRP